LVKSFMFDNKNRDNFNMSNISYPNIKQVLDESKCIKHKPLTRH